MNHATPIRRRLATLACATSLVLPLSLTAVATPAEAVTRTRSAAATARLVDLGRGPGGYSYGYGYPSPYSGYGYSAGGYDPYAGGSGTTATATASATDTEDATDAQSVGLVDVTSTIDYGEGTAAGTGMVLRSNGIVVTNHHVVAGATSIKVTVVSTGATYTAKVLGYDATRDVAVLQLVGATDLTTVDTDASGVKADEAVTAVGDANGDGGTLTAAPGTVTKVTRSITVSNDDGSTSRLRNLIEVTSDVIPGDSGGALLDAAGDVVGMNVAASSGTVIDGYVIPMKRVLYVVGQVLRHDAAGTVTLGYDAFLGIELGSGTTLAVAGTIADGPAATAGIVSGDTITRIDGRSVATVTQLHRALAELSPGDTVTVTWSTSSGSTRHAQVTVTRAPVA